jgi:hypothetical protein
MIFVILFLSIMMKLRFRSVLDLLLVFIMDAFFHTFVYSFFGFLINYFNYKININWKDIFYLNIEFNIIKINIEIYKIFIIFYFCKDKINFFSFKFILPLNYIYYIFSYLIKIGVIY